MFLGGKEELETHIADAEIVVTYGNDINDRHIGRAIRLKWLMVLSAGVDELPLLSIERKNILLTNVSGIHKTPMAEYVFSMLLQVYRQAKQLYENESNHRWDQRVNMVELSGKTMLILGTGAIGQEVARLAKAFQLQTIGISRSGQALENFDAIYLTDELYRLLPYADIVVSVLPSTKETKRLFTIKHFQQLPEQAVFLNRSW